RVGSSGELLRACAYLKRIACLRPQEAAGFECQRSVAGKAVPLTDDSKRSGGGQGHRLSCESAHPKPGKLPTFYSGSFNHSRRGDGAPGSPRAAAKAARAGASTASNRYGTFNSSIPLPFIRNGESSARTSNSATSADSAGRFPAERRNGRSTRRCLTG